MLSFVPLEMSASWSTHLLLWHQVIYCQATSPGRWRWHQQLHESYSHFICTKYLKDSALPWLTAGKLLMLFLTAAARSGASIAVQCAKLSLARLTPPVGVDSVLSSPAPCWCSWEVADDMSRSWVPAAQLVEPNGTLHFSTDRDHHGSVESELEDGGSFLVLSL